MDHSNHWRILTVEKGDWYQGLLQNVLDISLQISMDARQFRRANLILKFLFIGLPLTAIVLAVLLFLLRL